MLEKKIYTRVPKNSELCVSKALNVFKDLFAILVNLRKKMRIKYQEKLFNTALERIKEFIQLDHS